MQGRTALLEFFATGDFSTTQTSAQLYLDSFSTHAQGRSNRHLRSSLEVDAVLNLAGNGVPYDLCIQFRTTDLQDIDLHIILTRQLLQLFLNTIHFITAFTDNDTGLGSMDCNNQFT